MIVTLTLNPSLDLTYLLGERSLGAVDVHRARTSSVEASGKGVNVSRTLTLVGVPTVAVLPLGGETGHHLADLLSAERVEHVAVQTEGETRINTSLLLASGQTVKVNGPGAQLRPAEVEELSSAVDHVLATIQGESGDHWLAVCGSLPPGLPPEVLGALVDLSHRHSVKCAVDVSGPALAAAVRARADLVAPNGLELAELVGADPADTSVQAAAEAAASLVQRAGVQLLVSLGSEGAVHADHTGVLHGEGPVLVPVNTAGAGDALLAGWLAKPGPAEERMARALAFGRSACLAPTTVDPAPGSCGTEGITVRTLVSQPLKGNQP